MRSRAAHFACLLLLLSSLAVSNARAGSVAPTRTPGGTFIHNLLLQAVVDEYEPTTPVAESDIPQNITDASQAVHRMALPVRAPMVQTAHVHAVTGSSL
jgi:hypothetical protein